MMTNTYSKSFLQSSSAVQTLCKIIVYENLLPIIDSQASKQEPIDILFLHNRTLMDILTAFIFGLGNGSNFLRDPTGARKWFEIFQSRIPYGFWDGELPWAKTWSNRIGLPIVPAWVGKADAFIEDWCLEMCEAAKSWTASIAIGPETQVRTPAVAFDQLNKGIHSTTAQDPDLGTPDLQVASEFLDHLVAGHDTSAIALTYLYWELSRDPGLQAALREELKTLSPRISVAASPSSKELPSPRTIDSLPLLHATLIETLRIHSPIPGPQPRVTPSRPVNVDGSPP